MGTSSPKTQSFSETHGRYSVPVDNSDYADVGVGRAILHDDRLFPDPFTFKPERFIGPNVDPRVPTAVDYAFGFGRRVCPGRWMAHSFIFIVVASVLATFRIEKAVRDGRVVEPTGAFTPGILACVALSFILVGNGSYA